MSENLGGKCESWTRRGLLASALAGMAGWGLGVRPALAGKFNKKLNIGDRPEPWAKLPATTGDVVSLDDFKNQKLVVVVFTCNNCPVASAYEDRLIKLAEEYGPKSVAFVAINVNEGEDLAAMKQRAEEKKFNFPYVYDESQGSAKAYGASCTPHCFVLDANRAVVYMGAIDDNLKAAAVKSSYLKSALDQLLAGQAPTEAETRQIGCAIHWRG
ncbi:MAG: thioredoxin family protein [Pirellulales bacterium]